MKKTIIASAVAAAVAAPAAFADVKIGGMVAAEFTDSNKASTGTFGETFTDLVFSGSEDLGNGMKASFKYHIYHDNGGATCTDTDTANAVASQATGASASVTAQTGAAAVDTSSTCNADQVADTSVTLSGDFGAISAGRMELMVEGVMDATANIEGINTLDLEGTGFADAARANSNIRYTSPNMNGFQVAAGVVAGTTDMADTTEVMATYSANGLTVRLATAETDNDGASYDGIAVTYKIGDLELRALSTETKTSRTATANDYDMIGAKYTMGANTLSVGMADDGTTDITLVALTHALSKNTTVYLGYEDTDATGTSSDEKETVFGIQTKF